MVLKGPEVLTEVSYQPAVSVQVWEDMMVLRWCQSGVRGKWATQWCGESPGSYLAVLTSRLHWELLRGNYYVGN